MISLARAAAALVATTLGLTSCGGSGGFGAEGNTGMPPASAAYRVGGTVIGLAAGEAVQLDVSGSVVLVSQSGAFASAPGFANGASFVVTVRTAPPERRCRVTNGSGTVAGADVTSVAVDCGFSLLWVPDGRITTSALSPDGTKLYIGGDFTRVGAPTGSFVPVDPTSGERLPGHARLFEFVRTAVGDGQGGAYLTQGTKVVHVDAAGNIDPAFAYSAPGGATAMVLGNGFLYLATGAGDTAAIRTVRAATGVELGFRVGVQGLVNSMALAGGTLVIGGEFLSVAGQPRASLAAIDANTAALLPWNPNPTAVRRVPASIQTVSAAGDLVYVAGYFDSVGGEARGGLAAVSLGSARATPWNPSPDTDNLPQILAVAPSPEGVFVAGSFQSMGGAARNCVALLDATTGLALPWDAGVGFPCTIAAMALTSDTVYLGGQLGTVATSARPALAALSRSSGALLPFAERVLLDGASVLIANGSSVWVGGGDALYGGVRRRHLAVLDTRTGEALGWNPDLDPNDFVVNRRVEQLVVTRRAVVVRGLFRVAGGAQRRNLVALHPDSGQALQWDPGLQSGERVWALAAQGDVVYLAGEFAQIAGQARQSLAALDTGTLSLLPWSPSHPGATSLALSDDGKAYVVGPSGAKAFDSASGQQLAWTPAVQLGANLQEKRFTATRRGVYSAIGEFSSAAVEAQTGAELPWLKTAVYNIGAFFREGETLWAVRKGSDLSAGERYTLLRPDPATGAVLAEVASVNGEIESVVFAPDVIYISGAFGGGGIPRQFLWQMPR